jgi:hypothetical protein
MINLWREKVYLGSQLFSPLLVSSVDLVSVVRPSHHCGSLWQRWDSENSPDGHLRLQQKAVVLRCRASVLFHLDCSTLLKPVPGAWAEVLLCTQPAHLLAPAPAFPASFLSSHLEAAPRSCPCTRACGLCSLLCFPVLRHLADGPPHSLWLSQPLFYKLLCPGESWLLSLPYFQMLAVTGFSVLFLVNFSRSPTNIFHGFLLSVQKSI